MVMASDLENCTPAGVDDEELDNFKMVGLEFFFADDEDTDVDWEDVFDVKKELISSP